MSELSLIESPVADPPFQERRRALSTHTTPGYEILSELGRGGMGVVYKARDVRLKRIVALKMVLFADHAGSKDRERLKLEAEAVAGLQHRNIVQVYEVGETRGMPYLAMEYCANGSLFDRIRDRPQPPREAAQIIAVLARALHQAHQAGIIHRDLKPANILISADDTYKIADFGLAKRLDAEDKYTQTGMILGSLGYMAPEQAEARADAITPATDVYGLGALLYKLLTGRPPFQGANDWDTVEQIINTDAVSAQTLQPRIPRDLATICHKCLEKDPERRYPTAIALADDLERFLTDQPITARPLNSMERAGRWTRRHPAILSIVAASILLMTIVSGVLAWSAYRTYSLMNEVHFVQQPLQQSAASIRYLNEVLTSSAHLAVATGDSLWDGRYRQYEPVLEQTIGEAKALAPNDSSDLDAIEKANRAIVGMEKEALEKVRNGKADDARKDLTSLRYLDQKQQYTNSLNAFLEKLSLEQKAFLTHARQETTLFVSLALGLAALIAALFVLGLGMIFRSLKRGG